MNKRTLDKSVSLVKISTRIVDKREGDIRISYRRVIYEPPCIYQCQIQKYSNQIQKFPRDIIGHLANKLFWELR